MSWPPTVPSDSLTTNSVAIEADGTDNHAAHHDALASAIDDIVTRTGNVQLVTYTVDVNGNGDYTDLQSAINALGTTTDTTDYTKKGKIYVRRGLYSLGTTGLTLPSGLNGIEIECEGNDATLFTYTGSGVAFDVGNASADRRFLTIKNLQLSIGASATAGLKLNRVKDSTFDNIRIGNGTSGVGLYLDGTDAIAASGYTGDNWFKSVQVNACKYGIRVTGSDPDVGNANHFHGGLINCGLIASSIGIDLILGNANTFDGFDMSNCATGVKVAWKYNNFSNFYYEGNTQAISMTSSSVGNNMVNQSNVFTNTNWYTDAGTDNTIISRDFNKIANLHAVPGFTSVAMVAVSNVTTSSPGATIDSVTVNTSDRILLTGQSTGAENGLWIFNGSSSNMTRPRDYATGMVIDPLVSQSAGLTVLVNKGTIYTRTLWTMTNANQVVVGTTTTSWQPSTAVITGGLNQGISGTKTFLASPKMASGIALNDANAIPLIQFPASVSSAVNYAAITNNTTANPPTISASGSDTDVDLKLSGKNLGAVRASTHNAVTTVTVGGALFNHFADVASTGTTETDLYSDTLPAGILAVNGDKIKARYTVALVNSASTKQTGVYFGGTKIFDTGALTVSAASKVVIDIEGIRASSTAVRFSIMATITAGGTITGMAAYYSLTGLTLTNTQIMKITGLAAGGASADGDITAVTGSINWIPAA